MSLADVLFIVIALELAVVIIGLTDWYRESRSSENEMEGALWNIDGTLTDILSKVEMPSDIRDATWRAKHAHDPYEADEAARYAYFFGHREVESDIWKTDEEERTGDIRLQSRLRQLDAEEGEPRDVDDDDSNDFEDSER